MTSGITAEIHQELETLAGTLDEKLRLAGANQAEQAFGMGCALAFGPIAVVLLATYFLGGQNWTSVCIMGTVTVLLAAAVAGYIASKSRQGAMDRAYQHDILPEIQQFIRTHQLERTAFDALARQALSVNAPLQRYLGTTPAPMVTLEREDT